MPQRSLEPAVDPFAAPDPFAQRPGGGTNPMVPPSDSSSASVLAPVNVPYPRSTQPQSYVGNDDDIAGVPQGRPSWMIAVIVGVAALVVGGGIALIALR